ncbi:hypothetical protein EMIHUDRAFT_123650 [Emiliania huxleyi CCMP1516]|uniref:AP2/ERF domain-containing protein n=2 Tax=Emiliania huxleyi TaxID=2903 RepID=A0A0D3JKS3_EMIH1|nr:hypothetical protein EMIHUDRAFT_123650 [Emiliania huxleyi CCMP1516]EOD24108.1 hypothetical protein EMIHUDRAFT_123650 [Emiliania huxleyi CCMP1516]|eukprot:XP_005776537.1 hypothetical protein EMIHUDRAFT_123650 [Emiliania huxleyi CCMP1516]
MDLPSHGGEGSAESAVVQTDSDKEAAAALLRAGIVAEAEGLQLHLSSSSSSGYKGVTKRVSGRFEAQRKVGGRVVSLGTFDSAVEAAVAYARAVAAAAAATAVTAATAATSTAAAAATVVAAAAAADVLEPPHGLRLDASAAGRAEETAVVLSGMDLPSHGGEGSADSAAVQTDSDKEAAAALLRAGIVAEAEGLQLHLSSSSSTGYKGVREPRTGRFEAQRKVGGRAVSLGTFDSAVEAAVAYARAVAADAPVQTDSDNEAAAALLRVGVVAEAEGLRLHLSSNSTGYRGVYKVNGRFQAVQMGGKKVSLGCFGTAVEAAVAYARAVGERE